MRMIEITALDNGAHCNQTYHGFLPVGWAVIPDDLETPNFPFGVPETEEIDGTMTVTAWIPGVMPEPEAPPVVEATLDAAAMAAAIKEGVNAV